MAVRPAKDKDTRPGGTAPSLRERFRCFAQAVARAAGSPWMFSGAALLIVLWAASGPMFGFSDTWQLVINTGTTIVTFLMVFLIQNTQNRDARALHLKLDELLRAIATARTDLVDLEDLSEEQLDQLSEQFAALHRRAAGEQRKRRATAPADFDPADSAEASGKNASAR